MDGFRHIGCSERLETDADTWVSPQGLQFCGSGVGSDIPFLRPTTPVILQQGFSCHLLFEQH